MTTAGPRGRRMREARVWGHRCHRGRRLERGAQSPARPRAAAKDGLDRRAARRPRTPAPTRGSAPGPRQSLTRPGADISVPSFRTGVNPGSKAQKLPPYRGESKQREPAGLRPAGRALGALLGPLRLQSTLPPGSRVTSATAAHPPPPGCEMGDWPQRPPRFLPARDCGRPLPRGPGISLHLTGRRFTTKSPQKLPSQ